MTLRSNARTIIAIDRSCECGSLLRLRSALLFAASFLLLAAMSRPGAAADAVAPTIPGLVVSAPTASGPVPGSVVQPQPGLFDAPTKPKTATASADPGPTADPASKSKSTAGSAGKATKTKVRTSSVTPKTSTASETRIVALVNDAPITGFEVQQRSRFLALSTNIGDKARANMTAIAKDPRTNERLKAILQETVKDNQGKSRDQVIAAFEKRKQAFVQQLQQQAIASARSSVLPGMAKQALDELIEEHLKLGEAKKLSVKVSETEVNKVFEDMAKRNKMSAKEFASHIARQGADASVIRSRLRASLAWREVVRRRYGHQITVSQRDIEQMAQKDSGEAALELQLHRITLSTTGNVDQKAIAARLIEANTLRGQFKGCTGSAALAKSKDNAKFEDLGFKALNTFGEPTRSLLLSARDGEMLPANLGASGVELYAVCGRRAQKVDDDKRQAAENALTSREFEKLAQRYLYDLRKDALIEMR